MGEDVGGAVLAGELLRLGPCQLVAVAECALGLAGRVAAAGGRAHFVQDRRAVCFPPLREQRRDGSALTGRAALGVRDRFRVGLGQQRLTLLQVFREQNRDSLLA